MKRAFNKQKKTRDVLVGAPRFELLTSCAQGRSNIPWKSFLFNLVFENKWAMIERRSFGWHEASPGLILQADS
jgi:hypothetical protein